MTIELDDEVANLLSKLQIHAAQKHMTLGRYLEQLIGSTRPVPDQTGCSLAEFETILDELSAGLPPSLSLSVDFSRADIYADHE